MYNVIDKLADKHILKSTKKIVFSVCFTHGSSIKKYIYTTVRETTAFYEDCSRGLIVVIVFFCLYN